MCISSVKINNFTVFNDIEIDFSRGVNVLIGENGTGKTHLMKLLYAGENKKEIFDCFKSASMNYQTIDARKFLELLQSTENKINNLENVKELENKIDSDEYSNVTSQIDEMREATKGIDEILKSFKTMSNMFIIDSPETTLKRSKKKPKQETSNSFFKENYNLTISATENKNKTYVPAKEFLTHAKGFVSWYEERDIPFDKTYKDFVIKSLLSSLKTIPPIAKKVLPKIEYILGGKVLVDNDTFFIQKNDGSKIEFSVEAEGIKKIALLWQLIMNGSKTKGSVLFWDEPEANINPKLIPNVVEILLELSRQGVQIFVATHNYLFAKYMEVLSKDTDELSFHALYKTDNGVKCETQSKFSLLAQNSIREENINLYEAEIEKEMA